MKNIVSKALSATACILFVTLCCITSLQTTPKHAAAGLSTDSIYPQSGSLHSTAISTNASMEAERLTLTYGKAIESAGTTASAAKNNKRKVILISSGVTVIVLVILITLLLATKKKRVTAPSETPTTVSAPHTPKDKTEDNEHKNPKTTPKE